MTRLSLCAAALTTAVFLLSCSGPASNVVQTPAEGTTCADCPPSRSEVVEDVLWNVTVPDAYRWLEDSSQEEVRTWMGAQDSFARSHLGAIERRSALAERFRELFYIDSVSPPTRRGTRFFFRRRHAEKEKAVFYWREGEGGEEKTLLDPNVMSDDGSISVGVVTPSWDGTLVAYALRENNADEATLYVLDVLSGEASTLDVLEGAKYADPVWTPDSKGFYYTYLPTDPTIDVSERPGLADIRYHAIGTPQSDDVVVHEKTGDPTVFLGVDLSRDGRWLFAYVFHGWRATDVYLRDLEASEPSWQPLVTGVDAQFYVVPWDGFFYIATNDGAPTWRVLKAPAGLTSPESWKEIVSASDAVIDAVQVLGGHLVLTYQRNAQSALEVRSLDGAVLREIPLPGIGSTVGMTGLPEDDDAYFGFQSFTVPPRVFKTSISSGETELWAEVDVPIDADAFQVEQVWYESRDGTRVSMFVVTPRGVERSPSMPFLLYGYGGFNVSLRPRFRASIYPWLEAGGGYAVANLRGGGEYGEDWHRAGMLENKQNVFDDFIAAAEYLVAEGYTSPARLGIYGGSNGGLLVGAATVQRPDLFGAVVCAVPLLDMVRYHLFGSGKTWISEYGSVDQSEDMFRAIHAYSPYHHIQPNTDFPAMLFLSADSDDRVDPLHARKMVAALQGASSGARPILLRIESQAGHGGSDLIKLEVEKNADMYGFLLDALGVE